MKNRFFAAILGGSVLLLSSCDKEVDSTDLKVDLSSKAPVKGYVYAQLDKTKAGFEKAPEGTKVILSVNYSDFGVNANGKWLDTAIVDANGIFSADVPVDDNGVTLRIEPMMFEADQVNSFNANITPLKMIFDAPVKTLNNFTSSNNAIVQIFYDTELLASEVDFASVTFTIEAEFDTSAGNEEVVNKSITLYNSDWKETYTTDAKGKFVGKVPAGQDIYIDKIQLLKRVPDPKNIGKYIQENYEYSIVGTIGSFSSKSNATVFLGTGTKVVE